MEILKQILTALQQNAEWLCAIAITYFAYKQYAITKLQIQQDLRMRRLELAQKLDETCKIFPADLEETNQLMYWLISHQSEFIFLLKEKDCGNFAKLMQFTMQLKQKYSSISVTISINEIKQFYKYVESLDYALGNAEYGIQKIKTQKETKKMSLNTVNIFISHSWTYSDAYEKLINMLNTRPYFEYKNYSVPKDDPLHTKGNEKELEMAIENQISKTSVVLILAGVYASYSKWINKEVKIAEKLGKKIIAVEPFGSEKTSLFVKTHADYIVKWNTKSVIEAIRA